MRPILLGILLAGCAPARGIGDGDDPGSVFDTEPVGDDTEESVPDTDCPDADDDGFACDDCDDTRATVHPGADEACDGLDSDCVGGPAAGEALIDGAPACDACADAGYWPHLRDAADGDDLWDRLHVASAMVGVCDYGDATRFLFTQLDKVGGLVECVYTGFTIAVGNDKPDPEVMNVEHTWPQSQGGGEGVRECDLHHLFPTTAESNAERASFPLHAVVSDVDWQDGGSRLGEDAEGDRAFEPRDAHKGNAARALMYTALRYGNTLSAEEWALYRAWHELDPPDAREVDRTLTIRNRQGTANPFVACPEAVDRVTPP